MAFTRMAYTPATGLKDTATFPTTPASEDAARKQIQDVFDQVTTNVNGLIDALEDDTSGSSGAENIGSKAIAGVEVSAGVSAVTVYDQIAAVKAIADSASAGVLTSGSISASNMFGSNVVPLAAMTANSVGTSQIVDANVTVDKMADNSVGTDQIINANITAAKMAADSVETASIKNLNVTEGKIAAGAVSTTKIGTVQTITMDTGDTISYDTTNNLFMLNVSGCTAVQLCPIVFGTSSSAPAGTYPKGTIYMTHTA